MSGLRTVRISQLCDYSQTILGKYWKQKKTPPKFPSPKPLQTKRAIEFTRVVVTLAYMPIYEFHCADCGQDSEVLVRSSHWEGTPCPNCGSKKLTKKFSTFASANTSGSGEAAACTGQPNSCGLCGTGPQQ
ncbi:MAG: zinc ribbon domain-containing protein [Verrucomicrobia bacterium]|nr:zinc ribbon domain-containing protein [Verrucomicrobiota bacterium]